MHEGEWDVAFIATDWIASMHAQGCAVDLAPLLAADPPRTTRTAGPIRCSVSSESTAASWVFPITTGPNASSTAATSSRIQSCRPSTSSSSPSHSPRLTHGPPFITSLASCTAAARPLWRRLRRLPRRTQYRLRLPAPALDTRRRLFDSLRQYPFYNNRSDRSPHLLSAILVDRSRPSRLPNLIRSGGACLRHGTRRHDDQLVRLRRHGAYIFRVQSPRLRRHRIHPAQGRSTASLNVYWILSMAEGSPHRDIAWPFLNTLTPAMDKLTTTCGAIGCRRSTWCDAEVNRPIPFYRRMEKLHRRPRNPTARIGPASPPSSIRSSPPQSTPANPSKSYCRSRREAATQTHRTRADGYAVDMYGMQKALVTPSEFTPIILALIQPQSIRFLSCNRAIRANETNTYTDLLQNCQQNPCQEKSDKLLAYQSKIAAYSSVISICYNRVHEV